VPPDTAVNYDVQVANNSCDDATFDFNAFQISSNPDILINPGFGNAFVPAGTTADLPMAVSVSQDTEQFGTFQIFVNAELF